MPRLGNENDTTRLANAPLNPLHTLLPVQKIKSVLRDHPVLKTPIAGPVLDCQGSRNKKTAFSL
jgi:hypothetical protein